MAQVAADLGVAWATVMGAVREYGAPLADDPGRLAGVTAVGVDETAFLAQLGVEVRHISMKSLAERAAAAPDDP